MKAGKGWLKGILDEARRDVASRPEWQRCRISQVGRQEPAKLPSGGSTPPCGSTEFKPEKGVDFNHVTWYDI